MRFINVIYKKKTEMICFIFGFTGNVASGRVPVRT